MPAYKQFFFISTLVVFLVKTMPAQAVEATIDASAPKQPITKLIFGGFMEPATTGVWSEMLSDRKFYNQITSNPPPATGRGGFGMRGPARRWMPVGGDAVVTMDKKDPYVNDWSPLVQLDVATPHGISQSGIALVGGRAYSGRVVLAGSPGAKIEVSLVWGPNPADRETITINTLTTISRVSRRRRSECSRSKAYLFCAGREEISCRPTTGATASATPTSAPRGGNWPGTAPNRTIWESTIS
jgi:hypothetical protein